MNKLLHATRQVGLLYATILRLGCSKYKQLQPY